MIIAHETQINADAAEVWTVLGPRYAQADQWASSVNHSSAQGRTGGGALEGAPCTGRVCETELGAFQESLEIYNENTREIAYSATGEKMPFFVKKMVNAWKVECQGPGKAKVRMELRVSLMFPFNILMALPMRMQLGGVTKKANEELKYFIENGGTPHPRKQEAMRQFNGRQLAA